MKSHGNFKTVKITAPYVHINIILSKIIFIPVEQEQGTVLNKLHNYININKFLAYGRARKSIAKADYKPLSHDTVQTELAKQ